MTVDLLKIAKRLALVAGISTACMSGAYAQSSSTLASVPASASVVRPIVLTKVADLLFGNVVGSTAGGTLIVTPGGVFTFSAPALSPGATNVGTRNAASFSVTGEGGFSYALTLPSSAITLTDSATNTMSVGTFTSSLSGGVSTLAGSGAGTDAFTVGATLTVGTAQPAGTYNGVFSVTVAYN